MPLSFLKSFPNKVVTQNILPGTQKWSLIKWHHWNRWIRLKLNDLIAWIWSNWCIDSNSITEICSKRRDHCFWTIQLDGESAEVNDLVHFWALLSYLENSWKWLIRWWLKFCYAKYRAERVLYMHFCLSSALYFATKISHFSNSLSTFSTALTHSCAAVIVQEFSK